MGQPQARMGILGGKSRAVASMADEIKATGSPRSKEKNASEA